MTSGRAVLKILSGQEWEAFQVARVYRGSAVDVADGYIHFSTAAQIEATLAKHYAGQTGLVLLAVATEPLGAALLWEPARGGDLFPHLYGELPLSAVKAAAGIAFEGGVHRCPAEVLAWA
jgi:beta-hydroxylase